MQFVRAHLILAAGVIAAAVLAAASGGAEDKAGGPSKTAGPPRIGAAAPDFTLADADGGKHTLSDYRDKVVVLQWVNQECPWSVKAIPVIQDLQKKYADRDVVWLGVESTHWRTPEQNRKYIKDKQLAFPILMDNHGRVGRMYGAKTTPHVFVIDKQGKLAYMGGLHDDQYGRKKKSEVRNYLDEALTAVLAGKRPPVAETTPWGCSVKYKKKEKS